MDDGSTDDTGAALERLRLREPELVVLRHERNLGYGTAEKTLLDYAVREGAEVAILLHSDGQYAPESIPDLLEPFDRDEADIVQGSRMARRGALAGGMPLYKYVANKGLTALANWAFGMNMSEYYSGYMGYNRSALRSYTLSQTGGFVPFDLEMLAMARVKGHANCQIRFPTRYADEKSHLTRSSTASMCSR